MQCIFKLPWKYNSCVKDFKDLDRPCQIMLEKSCTSTLYEEAHFPIFWWVGNGVRKNEPITEETEYTWGFWRHLQYTSFILCSFFFQLKIFYVVLFYNFYKTTNLKSLYSKSNDGLWREFLFLFFLWMDHTLYTCNFLLKRGRFEYYYVVNSGNQIIPPSPGLDVVAFWGIQSSVYLVTFPNYFCKDCIPFMDSHWSLHSVISVVS